MKSRKIWHLSNHHTKQSIMNEGRAYALLYFLGGIQHENTI